MKMSSSFIGHQWFYPGRFVLLLFGIGYFCCVIPDAGGTEERVSWFDLPSRPLPETLAIYSKITGMSVLVQSDLTLGETSWPVKGHMAWSEALRILLKGTELSVIYTSPSAFTLVKKTAHQPTKKRATRQYLAGFKDETRQLLCLLPPQNIGRARVGLQVWIDNDGVVEHVHLLDSPGINEWGEIVRRAVSQHVFAPPRELAQPLTVILKGGADIRNECCRLTGRADRPCRIQ